MYNVFRKWKNKSNLIKDNARPDTIKGVEHQIELFEMKLSQYDDALRKIYNEKMSRVDFDRYK